MRSSSGERLRELCRRADPCRVFGVHDGLGARLAERGGMDALWVSGLGISASHAVPDASILTMTDFLAAARSVCSGSGLPFIADCDSGFGDANNVARMVHEYEAAGAAAVCIEDKLFPKRNSFADGQDLMGAAEFAGKITIAKEAQSDPAFMVWARLESLIAGAGLADALERAALYERAGADALLIHSKATDPTEVLQFVRRYRESSSEIPIALIPTTYPQLTVNEARDAGADIVVYANQGLRASITATRAVLQSLASTDGLAEIEPTIEPVGDVLRLIGMSELRLRDERAEALTAQWSDWLEGQRASALD